MLRDRAIGEAHRRAEPNSRRGRRAAHPTALAAPQSRARPRGARPRTAWASPTARPHGRSHPCPIIAAAARGPRSSTIDGYHPFSCRRRTGRLENAPSAGRQAERLKPTWCFGCYGIAVFAHCAPQGFTVYLGNKVTLIKTSAVDNNSRLGCCAPSRGGD